jgi:hypothetical protein
MLVSQQQQQQQQQQTHPLHLPPSLPTGMLVANDANRTRVVSVVHRARLQARLPLVLTNSDAKYFSTGANKPRTMIMARTIHEK